MSGLAMQGNGHTLSTLPLCDGLDVGICHWRRFLASVNAVKGEQIGVSLVQRAARSHDGTTHSFLGFFGGGEGEGGVGGRVPVPVPDFFGEPQTVTSSSLSSSSSSSVIMMKLVGCLGG
jgi:hypothetical protein